MSAMTSFRRLDRDRVDELTALVDRPSEFGAAIDACEDLGDVYLWSGYTFVVLMEYLGGREIYLSSPFPEAERTLGQVAGVGAYLLTAESFSDLAQLDPDVHDDVEIHSYFARLGVDSPHAAQASKDGFAAIRAQLHELRNDQVLLVLVG